MVTAGNFLNWQKLELTTEPESAQLEVIGDQLGLTLLALEIIAELTPDDWQRKAIEFDIDSDLLSRVLGMNLVNSDTQPVGSTSRSTSESISNPGESVPRVTADEARTLVPFICQLATENQPQIRRAVTLLEQLTQQGDDLEQSTLLQNYLETFQQKWQARSGVANSYQVVIPQEETQLEDSPALISESAEQDAFYFKFLLDLLFCSNPESPHWLWAALTEA
ncbi:MAG: DUF3038 domain-containing protein [Microcoleaceae cyanobacterium]